VKPLAELLQLLIGAAGRDGNMLLNAGPRPDENVQLSEVGGELIDLSLVRSRSSIAFCW
jgi:hypothetical protein